MSLSQSAEPFLRSRADLSGDRAIAGAMAPARRAPVSLTIETDLGRIAPVWRDFEREADGTAFQTFAWQSAWLATVGAARDVAPAIVIGRAGDGRVLFLFPLAVEHGGFARRLTWLAGDLCDYNGPLLARDFADVVDPADFIAVWREVRAILHRDPRLRHDAVVLDKMPERVGEQANPFLSLGVHLTPSGAYLTHLTGDWESFYAARRSSATRRRDRTKRKRLADLGAIGFVTPAGPEGVLGCLDTLFAQKAKSLARMGVGNMFDRPGVADFFRAVATDPAAPGFAHVSRLDVGPVAAAANFGLVFRGRYYHILASYDDGPVSRFGPGAAHLQELMRYAIGRGCGIFDFTIGDERYKRDWADTELKLYDHRSAVTPRGWVVALPAQAFARLKRTIKQTPILWRAFTAIRARLGGPLARGPGADAGEND